MRKLFLLIFLFIGIAGLCANPLLGIWQWDLFLLDNESGFFQFLEEGKCLVGEDMQYLEEIHYSINENDNIVYIDNIPWIYEVDGDSLKFFLSEEMIREELLPDMMDLSDFEESDDSNYGIRDELTEAIFGVLIKYPFLRGTRIEEQSSRRKQK